MSHSTTGDAFEIGTAISARPIQTLVVDALRSQRMRLLETMRAATERDWRSHSRCPLWNAQQVVLHICGANKAVREELAGERQVVEENFDPRTSPNRYVEMHASEAVADTLERLESSSDALLAVVDQRLVAERDDQVFAVWGNLVDWRLLVTHIFWDAWLHERDILLPLGQTHATPEGEARLAIAYGVLMAGVLPGFMGIPIDAELRLGGSGEGTFHLRVDGAADVRVRVEAPTPDRREWQGNALVVADALSAAPSWRRCSTLPPSSSTPCVTYARSCSHPPGNGAGGQTGSTSSRNCVGG